MKLSAVLTLLFILSPLSALAAEGLSFSFGPVEIGKARNSINLRDFKLTHRRNGKVARARFVKGSVQWVRDENNLLSPRARVAIKVKKKNDIFIKYKGSGIIPVDKLKHVYTEIYVNLFDPKVIEVFMGPKLIETITISAKKAKRKNAQKSKLIDYSCVPYSLDILGLEGEYYSIGCRLERTGQFGKERPRLIVKLEATNFTLPDGSGSPFTVFLKDNSPVYIPLVNRRGMKTKVKITAKLPRRMHRLKTAFGFGPYFFDSSKGGKTENKTIAPAIMLYGKFDLYENSSLRFFDALMARGTIFNNSGLYFAYTIASVFDNRLTFVPLLGAQGLSFKFKGDDKFDHRFIYPQGFEVVYKHAFGLENYTMVYGMFLSTSSREDYENLWLRMGKRWFLEINYIRWGRDDSKASMWGLSAGIPFFSLF
ncbi:hypothetical protein A9Q84_13385 [Halobacteriovorax marinus]|uniref:Uncharacterized protein n=1 Tax=Halobacteriovorax marinus TaxID=97084 RepID=A0A1Y5FFD1_9BACT|nr:hypothetical protein A9Q84_13385 [Halobacteriovorax marinus]